jgi:hypothetical protein
MQHELEAAAPMRHISAALAEVFRKAGVTRFRRAAEMPFNLVLDARH